MYYSIDKLLQTLYLPYIVPNNNYEIISNQKELFFLLKMTSYFMLALYSYTISNELLISKTKEKLALHYLLYIQNI